MIRQKYYKNVCIVLNRLFSTANPYSVLKISKSASDADVKKAQYKMAKEYHSDKGGSEEKMKQINQAYDLLKDSTKRAFQDRTGCSDEQEQAQKQASNPSSSNSTSSRNQRYKQSHSYQNPNTHSDYTDQWEQYNQEMNRKKDEYRRQRTSQQYNNGYNSSKSKNNHKEYYYNYQEYGPGTNDKKTYQTKQDKDFSNEEYKRAKEENERINKEFKKRIDDLNEQFRNYRTNKKGFEGFSDSSVTLLRAMIVRSFLWMFLGYLTFKIVVGDRHHTQSQRKNKEADLIEDQIWRKNNSNKNKVNISEEMYPVKRNGKNQMQDPKYNIFYEIKT